MYTALKTVKVVLQGRADYIMLLMHEDEENIKEILSHQMTTPTLTYLAFHHNNIRCARWLLSVGLPLLDGSYISFDLNQHFDILYTLSNVISPDIFLNGHINESTGQQVRSGIRLGKKFNLDWFYLNSQNRYIVLKNRVLKI